MAGQPTIDAALAFIDANRAAAPIVYSSDEPEEVAAAQQRFGRDEIAGRFEAIFAALTEGAVAAGFRRIVAAGGETSGAVALALRGAAFEIGPEIDPGVPALFVNGQPRLALALKSGNFGGPDFFAKAIRVLEG